LAGSLGEDHELRSRANRLPSKPVGSCGSKQSSDGARRRALRNFVQDIRGWIFAAAPSIDAAPGGRWDQSRTPRRRRFTAEEKIRIVFEGPRVG
jgi:hypothetical protein